MLIIFLGYTTFTSSYSQTISAVQIDSIQRLVDSATNLQPDSSQLAFVVLNPDRAHYFVDKIKDRIIVGGNDFMRWMDFTNQLRKDQNIETFPAVNKFVRPAWIIAVILMLFLGVGLVRFFFPSDFYSIIRAYYNERELQVISKEDTMLTSWSYIFLYILFSLSLGLFILLYKSQFSDSTLLTPLHFLRISGVVAVLFILKILIIRFIAFVFEIERLVRQYITVIYLVYFNSMLFLIPALLFVTFLPADSFKLILILFSIIVSILFLYRFSRTAWILFGNHKFSIFYLILYLCSLEIAPILVLVKALSD